MANGSVVVSVISLLVAITLLAWTVYDLQLKNRPYLYINLNLNELYPYRTLQSIHNLKASISITLNNKGNIPASDVRVEWDIRDDFGNRTTPDEFYKSEYKKIPEYKTVFPGEETTLPKYKPDISPSTTKLIINAKVYYTGMSRKFLIYGSFKQYWYEIKTEYEIKYDKMGYPVFTTLIYYYTNWDRSI
ncbi:MAG: hypothetical protein PHP46_01645 [Candidatus Omnitrophica bacterium]|nr:hypothetical protein [Candidatus Omnitrophota bacterium]